MPLRVEFQPVQEDRWNFVVSHRGAQVIGEGFVDSPNHISGFLSTPSGAAGERIMRFLDKHLFSQAGHQSEGSDGFRSIIALGTIVDLIAHLEELDTTELEEEDGDSA